MRDFKTQLDILIAIVLARFSLPSALADGTVEIF